MLLSVMPLMIAAQIGVLPGGTPPAGTPTPDTLAPAARTAVSVTGTIPRSILAPGIVARLDEAAPPADTLRRRRRAVELSDWYYRRLTIHRYVAYATLPVFALQFAAGEQLYAKGDGAPTWAKTMHRVGATSLAAMFTVNTVTGAWNWWDSRTVPEGRLLRTIHAISILGADAAFTYTGVKLSNDAEFSSAKRRQHRTVALASIGVTIASGLAMKLWNQ